MEDNPFSFRIFGGHVLLLHLRQLPGLSGQYPALHPAFVRTNFNSPANTFTFRGSYKHFPVHLQPKEKGLDLLYNLYPHSGIFSHNLLNIKDGFYSFHRNLANLIFSFLDETLEDCVLPALPFNFWLTRPDMSMRHRPCGVPSRSLPPAAATLRAPPRRRRLIRATPMQKKQSAVKRQGNSPLLHKKLQALLFHHEFYC